jgi:glycosyltransferase involved in cell wall biosynthesis
MYIKDMNKPRVLHLITGLERGGGAENMLLNIVPKLKGHNVVCVLKGRGEIAQELEDKGVKIFYLDIKNPVNLNYIFKYRKVIKEFEPDIQINYLIHADIFGRIFGKLFKVPKVVSYIRNRHEEKGFFWLDKITLFLADYILVNSEPLIKFYTDRHGVSSSKIEFIPNAVNLEKLAKLSQEEISFSFDKSKKYIISTARLHSQKDLVTLIKAFKLITSMREDLELIIANDGPQKDKLKKLTVQSGLESKIHFIGKKENIYPYLISSDLFVLTSKFEGMSNALLEALALKVTVIVSDIPENTQLVSDVKNIFRVGDVEDLMNKIINFLDRNESCEAINSICKYSLDDVIIRLNDFIQAKRAISILYITRLHKAKTDPFKNILVLIRNSLIYFDQEGYIEPSLESVSTVKRKKIIYLKKTSYINKNYDVLIINYKSVDYRKTKIEKEEVIKGLIKDIKIPKILLLANDRASEIPNNSFLDEFKLMIKREPFINRNKYSKLSTKNKKKIVSTMLPCQYIFVHKNILGIPLSIYFNKFGRRTHDKVQYKNQVSFVGKDSSTNSIREQIVKKLISSNKVNFVGGLQISNNNKLLDNDIFHDKLTKKEYVDLINETKINLALDGYGEFTFRHLEVLYLGGFLISSPSINELELPVNFIDGKHYISFINHDDLIDKIIYYSNNDIEREKIAKNGQNFLMDNYNIIKHGEDLKKRIVDIC